MIQAEKYIRIHKSELRKKGWKLFIFVLGLQMMFLMLGSIWQMFNF